MPLPEFNEAGDLPPGVYRATLVELMDRFGSGTARRAAVANRLRRIFDLASATGGLDRLIVFGSFVTDKAEPNDVDVVLVFREGFDRRRCSHEAEPLFDHQRASDELGASIFWMVPSAVVRMPLDEFIAGWQIKRDQGRRGIVELRP